MLNLHVRMNSFFFESCYYNQQYPCTCWRNHSNIQVKWKSSLLSISEIKSELPMFVSMNYRYWKITRYLERIASTNLLMTERVNAFVFNSCLSVLLLFVNFTGIRKKHFDHFWHEWGMRLLSRHSWERVRCWYIHQMLGSEIRVTWVCEHSTTTSKPQQPMNGLDSLARTQYCEWGWWVTWFDTLRVITFYSFGKPTRLYNKCAGPVLQKTKCSNGRPEALKPVLRLFTESCVQTCCHICEQVVCEMEDLYRLVRTQGNSEQESFIDPVMILGLYSAFRLLFLTYGIVFK